MLKEYLDRLPNDIRILVEQIEQDSCVEITVEVDPSRARGLPNRPDTLACEVDKHGAKILIPTREHFPDDSVLHELLHIRRFLLHGIPRIIASPTYNNWTSELNKALGNLDNSLEHLVIVPEELEHRPKRKSYWENVMHRVLEEIESANISDDDRKRLALINWVFIQHVVPEHTLIDKASKLILYLAANDRARRITEALISSLHSKERTAKLCFKHLCLQEEAGCLEYVDRQRCRSHIISLANVSMND